MQFQNYSDETLVLLTLTGEQRAYEELVIRHQRMVIAAAYKVTESRYMAEDAAQDAFVTGWMKLDSLTDPARFAPWVCRIARNCALNMVTRTRACLSLDALETDIADHAVPSPASLTEAAEEAGQVQRSVDRLPERVKTVIQLHYFEGLSIAQIADRLRVTQGTVKAQLYDGRRKIRKELCAMHENWNDTLVEKVMKKVEELKNWKYLTKKDGFETAYRDVLGEVESLPESEKKYHALADTLLCGWWWIDGAQNDELFARIREAAERGHNDAVMCAVALREDQQIPYRDFAGKIAFIGDKQLPRLAEYPKALVQEWFWLGHYYYKNKQSAEGDAAMAKVLTLAGADNPFYTWAKIYPDMWKALAALGDTDEYRYRLGAGVNVLRMVDGGLRYDYESAEYNGNGYLRSVNREIHFLLDLASRCDRRFFDPTLTVGETIIGSDGTTLTFAADHESVETPAGVFDNCQLWTTKYRDKWKGLCTCQVWYKAGLGIVRYVVTGNGCSDTRVLSEYRILGGEGLLPLAIGNFWKYIPLGTSLFVQEEVTYQVGFADGDTAIVGYSHKQIRTGYDENDWLDMMQKVRCDYCSHGDDNQIQDVSHAIERAEALAVTPMEKAHTKAAASVVRRIMATDNIFSPQRTADNIWNFFNRYELHRENGCVSMTDIRRFSFEWKCWDEGCEPVLCNHIYSILAEAADWLWSDEWKPGYEATLKPKHYDNGKTTMVCTDCGTVTTKAGTFEGCMKLALDIQNVSRGYSYRGGKKEYYFAPGVGIVKIVNEFGEGTRNGVYELSSYVGTGEGYMPFGDGMVRKYEAIGLTDGYYGAAEYTYVADEAGDIVIFADKNGIRKLPEPITFYGAIQKEQIEGELWDAGKHDESRLCHDLNNFNILQHFLLRPNRYWAAQEKASAWNAYALKILEDLGGGTVPDGWLGYYWTRTFRYACSLFGCGRREEGYANLDKAFAAYDRWRALPKDQPLEVGDPLLYGGIQLFKGRDIILLPDGTKEPLHYADSMHPRADLMVYGMTAPQGWEWFNPVRDEELYKSYVERAKQMLEDSKA